MVEPSESSPVIAASLNLDSRLALLVDTQGQLQIVSTKGEAPTPSQHRSSVKGRRNTVKSEKEHSIPLQKG